VGQNRRLKSDVGAGIRRVGDGAHDGTVQAVGVAELVSSLFDRAVEEVSVERDDILGGEVQQNRRILPSSGMAQPDVSPRSPSSAVVC
jgi:hypothetical protein